MVMHVSIEIFEGNVLITSPRPLQDVTRVPKVVLLFLLEVIDIQKFLVIFTNTMNRAYAGVSRIFAIMRTAMMIILMTLTTH